MMGIRIIKIQYNCKKANKKYLQLNTSTVNKTYFRTTALKSHGAAVSFGPLHLCGSKFY